MKSWMIFCKKTRRAKKRSINLRVEYHILGLGSLVVHGSTGWLTAMAARGFGTCVPLIRASLL